MFSRFSLLLGLSLMTAMLGCTERAQEGTSSELPEPKEKGSEPLYEGEVLEKTPLLPRASRSTTLFQRRPASETGVDFVHQWKPRDRGEHDLMATAFAGGAVALGDLEGDGFPEIFLTRPHGGARLYRNLQNFRFVDITAESGLEEALRDHWSTGATFVDIEGDGDLDLVVCGYDCPNRLFVNEGESRFVERAQTFGLAFSGASVALSFTDYDRDGDLDAYLLTNRLSGQARPEALRFEVREGQGLPPEAYRDEVGALLKKDGSLFLYDAGQADRLYRNDEGKFVDVSSEASIRGHWQGLSATWWDFDADGWMDLYVANDFYGPDRLYQNQQDGTFRDVIAETVPHTPWFAMGSDVGDLNGDGRLDFIVADMAATTHYKQKVNMGDMNEDGWFLEWPLPRQYMRNAVYVNTGTSRFLEVGHLTGLAATDWTWAVKMADFDADGRLDVFFSNGMTRPFFHADYRAQARELAQETGENRWSDFPMQRERNLVYQNQGEWKFVERSRDWGLDEETVSFGTATGDLDGDGDLDLVVNHFVEPVGLYANEGVSGHCLKLALRGSQQNSRALGAEVRLETSSGKLVSVLQSVRGYGGSDPAELVFGLGEDTEAENLRVRWPDGREQSFPRLEAGYRYVIGQTASARPSSPALAENPWFAPRPLPQGMAAPESAFDDFERQPLLPNKLSTQGPAMAWGDLDGNGRVDVYLGGAAGEPGQLWLQSGDGRWFRQRLPFFEDDRRFEDVDATFFDADNDGDLDLYVVSGGVEGEDYRDRLYLSVPQGLSTALEGYLPKLSFSGSCVAVGDVDGDGDLDLFIGGRVIPGQYPLAPSSQLLINDGTGRFRAAEIPALNSLGMVTDAVWADIDRDGDSDLMVTTEYGAIQALRNDKGRLAAVDVGLNEQLGWWTRIAASDVDGDGDIDFAVGNFGRNTKYHPSPEQPQSLYYGDFDGSGRAFCVEAHPNGDVVVPNRGLSCSRDAMGFIGEKFSTFHAFAVADLAAIYSPERLEEALRLEVNQLSHGILLNQGEGTFDFRPLPTLAQVAPCLGLAFLEVNGDGVPDLYVSQNFFGPQRETGRMSGGLGALLLGQGDGTFQEVWAHRSGIVLPEDARHAVVVDVDADGGDDLVVAVNDGPVRLFRRLSP